MILDLPIAIASIIGAFLFCTCYINKHKVNNENMENDKTKKEIENKFDKLINLNICSADVQSELSEIKEQDSLDEVNAAISVLLYFIEGNLSDG